MKAQELSKLFDELKKHFESDIKLLAGYGSFDAKIILIGEAPGKNEIEQGKPFVGQAGKNLNEFLEILKISREQIYITNVVKFRPVNINEITGSISNRTPTKKEVDFFTNFLLREVAIIEPILIISLGNIALKSILGNPKASIGDYHGNPIKFSIDSYIGTLFPLYHPASIIYRSDLKDTYIEDLYKLRQYIDENKIF